MKDVTPADTHYESRQALPMPVKKKRAIPAMAVCLCLVTVLLCLVPLLSGCIEEDTPSADTSTAWVPVIGEDIPEMTISAEPSGIPSYIFTHTGVIVQMGTFWDSWYDLAREEDVLNATPIPDGDYLPIYAQTTPSLEEELDDFIQRMLPTVQALTGITETDYTIQHNEEIVIPYPDSYNATVGSDPDAPILFEVYENDCLTLTCPIELLTETQYFRDIVIAPPIDTEEEILESLVHTIRYLTQTTGLEFRETTYDRRERGDYVSDYSKMDVNDVVVTMVGYPHENTQNLPKEIASIPAYTLTIRYRYDNLNHLVPESLIYREPLYDGSHTVMVGKAKTYTLEEAKALLEAGYVYSGMMCTECRKTDMKTDISAYEAVGVVYVKNRAGVYNQSLPFYAFYKRIGQDEEGDIYAAAYVPAVPFDGLEDYFTEKTRKHRH